MWASGKWCLWPNVKWKMVIFNLIKCVRSVGIKAKFGGSLAAWPKFPLRDQKWNFMSPIVIGPIGDENRH